jgi:hypothetical protein
MKKVRITESQLKGLVRRMINEEMEDRSYDDFADDPTDYEPPRGSFKEKNPTINVKGLSVADAIKKIKSEIYPLKVLSVDTLGNETIILKTFIDRYSGVSEGYSFDYKKSKYTPLDPSTGKNLADAWRMADMNNRAYLNGIATTDASFDQFEFH